MGRIINVFIQILYRARKEKPIVLGTGQSILRSPLTQIENDVRVPLMVKFKNGIVRFKREARTRDTCLSSRLLLHFSTATTK